jgi:hypothetical protein
MSSIPLVLLHGYHSEGAAYNNWRDVLSRAGFKVEDIFIGNYVTLNNEINVDDIAEGFDRALRSRNMADKPFDVMVHSTGMLVLRSWLTAPGAESRQKLLKHLIALAPATFGSPLATKGRSLLGRIFLGSHVLGPDFLNSGKLVLNNLELASEYTWYLSHKDLFGPAPFYDDSPNTPYVFVFDGTSDYGKLAEIFVHDDQLGTDGCVRWAGASLNCRKITLDFTLTPANEDRFTWTGWTNSRLHLTPIDGINHNEILSKPPQGLQDLVIQALRVASNTDLDKYYTTADNTDVVKQGRSKMDAWQQFIVHAVDERGNGIDDYSIEVLIRDARGNYTSLSDFEKDVHPYSLDKSFRAFHVQLTQKIADAFGAPGNSIIVRFRASSGTDIVRYQGFGDPTSTADYVELDITSQGRNSDKKLFCPFTTTLMEVRLNREPIPLRSAASVTVLDYEIFQFLVRT